MIYLIRHGEPEGAGVLLGRLDPPLLARPLPMDLVVQSVFSSPLGRARQTAAALFPSITAQVLDDLTEISLGEWDGLTWAEILRRDPVLAERKLSDWFGAASPGGEDWAAIVSRAAAALRAIRDSARPAVVVAHVGINAVLWHLLTGEPAAEFRQAYLEVKTHADMA